MTIDDSEYDLQVTAQAVEEIDEIQHYYREHTSEEISNRFYLQFQMALENVICHPRRWTKFKDSYRCVQVEDFPYTIFYQLDESHKLIQIVAVAHEKRKPGYWIDKNS